MENDKKTTLGALALLAAIAAITYLPLAPWLGYYRDDWNTIWAWYAGGFERIVDLYRIDRPLAGYTFAAGFSLVGISPLAWQLYSFALRLAGGLGLYWLARLLFPRQRRAALLVALLGLVYPGFLQQADALAYNAHILGFTLGVFSLALSLFALTLERLWQKALLTAAAVLSGWGCFLIMEYMVGLEAVRFILICYVLVFRDAPLPFSRLLGAGPVLRSELRRYARLLVTHYLPYLAGLGAFLFWRVIIFKSARSATDIGALGKTYTTQPLEMLLRLIFETGKDFVETVLLGWFVPLYRLTARADYADLALSLGLALAVTGLLLLYRRLTKAHDENNRAGWPGDEEQGWLAVEDDGDRGWVKAAVWLGLLCALAALLPAVLANRQVEFSDAFDRYTLPGLIGAALLAVGLIYALLPASRRTWVLGTLVGLAVVTHFNNAAFFRDYWEMQRQLWWQLSWRAPDLKQDTALVTLLPEGYRQWESYEIWGPANMIYHPQPQGLWLSGEVLNQDTLIPMLRQESFLRTMRKVEYGIDYKNSLIASYPARFTCVHVLDGTRPEISEYSDPLVRLVAHNSNPAMIEVHLPQVTPPATVFGAEPAHTWCYYYQKASLARQRQDWAEAARLGDEAQHLGYVPADDAEWMPFYEAYAHLRRFDEANRIGALLRENYRFTRPYCDQFNGMSIPPGPDARIERFVIENICGAGVLTGE